MSKPQILVIEDDPDILKLISLLLSEENYEVFEVSHPEKAFELLNKGGWSLIIVDWMLPAISGLEIIKQIRQKTDHPCQKTPILMLTARSNVTDIVLGIEMGADDYVTKPFEIPVFKARVRALLRRLEYIKDKSPSDNLAKVGELTVDLETYDVKCKNKEVKLTASEFKLLVALIENKGRVLTREKLIDKVQGEGVSVVDRAIDTHIFGLRKKLGACSDVIETIRSVGYRIKE